jgi:hypothetical protein
MLDNGSILSIFLSTLSTGIFVILSFFLARNISRHFLFLFFLFLCLVYTQISPTITLLLDGLPGVLDITGDYAQVQSYYFIFFFLPIILLYLLFSKYIIDSKSQPRAFGVAELQVNKRSASALAISLSIFALLYMFFLIRNDLLFSRIGAEYLAERLVSLPTLDFSIIRLYQDTALFFIIVLYVTWYITPKKTKTRFFVWISLLINLTLWGIFIILNSRLSILTGAACLFGIWLILTGKNVKQLALFARIFFIGVVALYLTGVVINVRTIGFSGTINPEFFTPQLNIFGDSQGFNRLNCVDLIARMNSKIETEGPAWGVAWGHVYWNFGRFIDPGGFDRFRLSLDTTSKTYLMRRYLDWDLPDYYSCALTDFYGNFHVLGLFTAAIIYALIFIYAYKYLSRAASPYFSVGALYIVVAVLIFDQEASSLLFSWTKELPIIALVLFFVPFKANLNKSLKRRLISVKG